MAFTHAHTTTMSEELYATMFAPERVFGEPGDDICQVCARSIEYHPHTVATDSRQCAIYGGSANVAIVIRACGSCDNGFEDRYLCDPELCHECAVKNLEERVCDTCGGKMSSTESIEIASLYATRATSEMIKLVQLLYNEVVSHGIQLPADFALPRNEDTTQYLEELAEVASVLTNLLDWTSQL